MATVNSTDAKNQLNKLLTAVKGGETVTITRHGEPVARLVPITPTQRRFGQLPHLSIPNEFDEPLPVDEIEAWEPEA